MAAYSRNRIIHFFVTRAITELVLLHLVRRPVGHPGEGDLGARAWAEALRLRDLLKYEFFFAAKPEFAEELRAELAILDPDWERKAADPDRHRHRPGRAAAPARPPGPRLVPRGLHGGRRPARRPPAGPGRREARSSTSASASGRQYRLQQRIHSGESISKELFKNALALAAGRGLLADPGTDPDAAADIARRRDAFAAELREVVDRVDSLRRLAGAALERTTAEEGPE